MKGFGPIGEGDLLKKIEQSSKEGEGKFDYTGEKGGANHPENKYNNPGMDEVLTGDQEKPGDFDKRTRIDKPFVPIEEVADRADASAYDYDYLGESGSADEIYKELDEFDTSEKEPKGPADDPYELKPLITKLFTTLDQEDVKDQAKHDRKVNRLLERANTFLREYKAILAKELPARKEYAVVWRAFKNTIGELVYSDNKIEVLPKVVVIGQSKPGQFQGEPVAPVKKPELRRHNIITPRPKTKPIMPKKLDSENLDIVEDAGEDSTPQVFNPLTGRREKI